ncbi:Protein kinase domain-containing protein [Aphelenchoides besseyi]|nr:Protein kinase domain-containing protein [Aphelenchoides besseyi]
MSTVLITHNACRDNIRSAVLSNVIFVQIDFENSSLKSLIERVLKSTSRAQIRHLGLYVQTKRNGTLALSGSSGAVINRSNLTKSKSNLSRFVKTLASERFLPNGTTIDFLTNRPVDDHTTIANILKKTVVQKVRVRFVVNFTKTTSSDRRIVELYVNPRKLMATTEKSKSAQHTRLPSYVPANYDRIRVVGKGSFGSAILYRRKDDDSLVILKEINMHELSPAERQLALNEVTLLSRLDHPNIISYYDSFAEDGVLMIEMEYALLARREDYLEEAEIMYLFEQMVSAVAYLHDNEILHRDLKSANIFLTKDNLVKIGDFGISKIMGAETKVQGAQTILGTPYYLSPEMENHTTKKSDIWALGCCLYEMVCLQKPFDASSLPALVTKIVHANYEQVKGPYSNELKLLIRDIFKTNPEQRPTALDVLRNVQRHRAIKNKTAKRPNFVESPRPAICYSVLYQFDIEKVTLSAVPTLPNRINIKQLAISQSHYVILTSDAQVYTWGENKNGQLGHGDRKSRISPTIVDALQGRNVQRVAVGESFTVVCAEQGIVLICGHRRFIGVENAVDDALQPRLVDALLRENISDIACGDEHIIAVTESGQVYVWGCGADGRLGTGDTDDVTIPLKLDIPTKQLISNVKAGPDCSALITSSGTIVVMGSNRHNKLNLNYRQGFFANVKHAKSDIANILKPTPLKPFPSRVVDACLGYNHSGVLLENGHVHLFGRNTMGELGNGNRQNMQFWMAYRPVKPLVSKICVQLICGNGFTMAATSDNELYFWGAKGLGRTEISTARDDKSSRESARQSGPRYKSARKTWQWRKSYESCEDLQEQLAEAAVTQPTLVMRLDSARTVSGKRPFIRLSSLVCANRYVMLAIDTSPMLLEAKQPPNTSFPVSTHERRRSAPELAGKSSTQVATWVRKEMDDAEFLSYSQLKPKSGSNDKTLRAEQQLKHEIENLKKQIQEQNNTFRGHQSQMSLLQQKLNELQQLQRQAISNSPPPAYSNGKCAPRTLKNPFMPEVKTKVCVIM